MTSREPKAPKMKFNDTYYITWHLTPQASRTPTTHKLPMTSMTPSLRVPVLIRTPTSPKIRAL